VAQQTPWAQMLPLHSLFVVHEPPTGLRPQLLVTQALGGAHARSLEQLVTHRPRALSQTKGRQGSASGYTHTEAPLQVAGGV
jgi:hypothetical protein